MKKILLALTVLFVNVLSAQEIKLNARTGDVEMDGLLAQKNDEGKKDPYTFVSNVANTFGLVKTEVEKLMKIMAPGDVYMAAQMANTLGKPVTEVSDKYMAHKDKGWGAIAKEMGIKPGSPEFHKMKKAMKSHGNGPGSGGGKGKAKDGDDKEDHEGGEGKGHGNGHGHGKGKK